MDEMVSAGADTGLGPAEASYEEIDSPAGGPRTGPAAEAGGSLPPRPLAGATVSFVGAGSMARAMVSGLLASGTLSPHQIRMTNRNRADRLEAVRRDWGVEATADKARALAGAQVVVLAVKPSDIAEAARQLRPVLPREALVVSVAAGVPLALLDRRFGGGTSRPLVRAMPNVGSHVGASATAFAAKNCTPLDEARARALLEPLGLVCSVPEGLLDAVTGLSGSGPAYVFRLVEGLITAGRDQGIPAPLARDLAVQTLLGAARLLQETGLSPEELRRQVMSPGGTTEAGLAALDQQGFMETIGEAVARATRRAGELADYPA